MDEAANSLRDRSFRSESDGTLEIHVDEAERMALNLKRIQAGLNKISEDRGYPRSFGEYCGRVAEVLKCKGMAHQREPEYRRDWSSEWEWTSIGDGVNRIQFRIHRWSQQGRQAEQTA